LIPCSKTTTQQKAAIAKKKKQENLEKDHCRIPEVIKNTSSVQSDYHPD
jgi:hypothetical protein